MKTARILYLVALVSTAIFMALQWVNPDVIREKIESKTYDLRLMVRNHFNKQSALSNIVIVTIDEKSIKETGRWPWSRDIQAGLISNISKGAPKVIGIDIMYTETDKKEADRKLAQTFKEAGNIVLATPFFVTSGNKESVTAGDIPDFLWDTAFMQVISPKWIKWTDAVINAERINPPIEILAESATLGSVYTLSDMEGVIRWEPMFLRYGGDCYPQFSLQIARIALGLKMKDMVLYPTSAVKLGDSTIKTNLEGRVLINYIGKENSFQYISASDVINNRTPSELFKDKIVLVGTTALAAYDQKITPLSSNMPGVEKNATVVQNILLNNFLTPSPKVIEVVVIICTGILLGLSIPRLRALKGAFLATGLTVLYIVLSFYLLMYHGIWINLVYPVSNMLSIFAIQTIVMFIHEEKRAKEIRKMFSSYVSPKIVDILINNPEKAGIGGVRREITVLFSDIRGFTSISEKYSPEDVVAILNEYLGEMTEIVFKWDGTLDKFIGDAILAFWGAPLIQEDHAELAIKCALNMSAKLDELQEKWKAEGKPKLDIGIGINTGEVLVGNIGAVGKKMDYTVIGDHVNLGSRVESLTKKYNTRILITEYTLSKIRFACESGAIGHVAVTGKEKVIVKGKEKPVGIFSLTTFGHSTESSIIECEDRIVELKEK